MIILDIDMDYFLYNAPHFIPSNCAERLDESYSKKKEVPNIRKLKFIKIFWIFFKLKSAFYGQA